MNEILPNTKIMLLPKEAQDLNKKGWILKLVDKEDKKNTPAQATKGQTKRKYFVCGRWKQ